MEGATINRNHAVARMQFAQPNQAQIRKVRLAISVACGQCLKLGQLIVAVESQRDELPVN